MKQKGMAILTAVLLLAASAASPVYAEEEIFSFEAIFAGGSQDDGSSAPEQIEAQPKAEEKQAEAFTEQKARQSSEAPEKKKIVVRKKQEAAVQVSTLEQSVVTSLGAGVKIIAFNPKRPIVQIPQEKTEEPAPSSADDFPYTLESFAEEVLRLTNEARAEVGAPPLELDPTLQEMAQARKDENKGKMTHTRPDGTTADTIFKEYETNLKCTGEIIIGVCSSPEAVVNGFLASKAHRENMLNPDHAYVGIGVSWGETPAGTGIAVLELFAK